MMQTEVADAHEAMGQDVGEEAPNKLMGVKGHELLFAFVAVVAILEGHGVVADREDTVIGNGNAENVTSEVFDQFLGTIERTLDVDFPVLG